MSPDAISSPATRRVASSPPRCTARGAARRGTTAPMLAALLLIGSALPAATAEPQAGHLGDHPAVVVQRLHKAAGYDYAAKFYPHPAWLWLRPAQDSPEDFAGGRNPPAAGDPTASPSSIGNASVVKVAPLSKS